MIKKVITAAFVALTFVIYSLHQRSEGNAAVQQVTSGATSTPTTAPTTSSSTTVPGQYKDGTYTGTEADAIYGYIKVKVTVSGGRVSDVAFLEYPNDRRDSIQINEYAMPILKQQAIQAQSAQVDGVSGATDTSQAFVESLTSALSQAKA